MDVEVYCYLWCVFDFVYCGDEVVGVVFVVFLFDVVGYVVGGEEE